MFLTTHVLLAYSVFVVMGVLSLLATLLTVLGLQRLLCNEYCYQNSFLNSRLAMNICHVTTTM